MLLAAACGSSGPRSTAAVLLPDVGDGYRVSSASGPLSKDAFLAATALPKAVMASYLQGVHWRGASERVWTSPEDGFVTDLVATFGSGADAQRLVSLAARALPGPATRLFVPSGEPAARGFVQTSAVHGSTMFCVFAFAPSEARVFVLTRCTPYPQDTATLERLLGRQLGRAR